MKYIDHFNTESKQYQQFRPDYPDALYQFLATLTPRKSCIWDCATGSGQAALALVKYFDRVIATDINRGQLDAAPSHQGVYYLCCPAEKTPLSAQSIDMVTVAQALHWFDFDLFYQEVQRVCKPSAYFAAWCYTLIRINSDIDSLIDKLYTNILGEYWPVERRYIDEEYRTIPFPFEVINTPGFTIEKEINFDELIGYLLTWSGLKEYQSKKKSDPMKLLVEELAEAWGASEKKYLVHWPIHLRVGRV